MEFIMLIMLLLSGWLVSRKNLFGISGFMGSLAGLLLMLMGVAVYGCLVTVMSLIVVIDLYVLRLRKQKRAFTDYHMIE